MADNYSSRGRFLLMGTGENNNTWGSRQNTSVYQLVDDALYGFVAKALNGSASLTTADGATSEARQPNFKLTGTGGTLTVPSLQSRYTFWNACTGVATITNGSTSVTVQIGECVHVITDGATAMKRVVATDMGGQTLTNLGAPSNNTDAATKQYADNLAFTANAGILPAQVGNEGKTITTNGTTARWSDPPRLMRRNLFFDKRVA